MLILRRVTIVIQKKEAMMMSTPESAFPWFDLLGLLVSIVAIILPIILNRKKRLLSKEPTGPPPKQKNVIKVIINQVTNVLMENDSLPLSNKCLSKEILVNKLERMYKPENKRIHSAAKALQHRSHEEQKNNE
jgi:hypothetical protein